MVREIATIRGISLVEKEHRGTTFAFQRIGIVCIARRLLASTEIGR